MEFHDWFAPAEQDIHFTYRGSERTFVLNASNDRCLPEAVMLDQHVGGGADIRC